ncbi:MAG: pantetheine-phosphate adenylyltransferase [Candidatus Omnitrophica bacterium]|nr:pantetheine-phosphate adenylyltransferase [Candidatus Omnitrophota bacterium]
MPARRIAIYPGTFDPITNGHIDLIRRARAMVDELIVAVAHNAEKRPLFSVRERVAMVRRALAGMAHVRVVDFGGLAVAFARRQGARTILRGVRMVSDFEYEFQLALTNRKLDPGVETIFMMPSESYAYLSSRLIKEAAALGATVSAFVPRFVETALKRKLRSSRSRA